LDNTLLASLENPKGDSRELKPDRTPSNPPNEQPRPAKPSESSAGAHPFQAAFLCCLAQTSTINFIALWQFFNVLST